MKKRKWTQKEVREWLKNIIHSSILIQMTRTYLYENTMEFINRIVRWNDYEKFYEKQSV